MLKQNQKAGAHLAKAMQHMNLENCRIYLPSIFLYFQFIDGVSSLSGCFGIKRASIFIYKHIFAPGRGNNMHQPLCRMILYKYTYRLHTHFDSKSQNKGST